MSEVLDPGVGRTAYFDPAWSSDGRRLAFTSYVEEPDNYLSVALTQGQEWRRRHEYVPGAWVFVSAGITGLNGMPSWAPDKRRVVLVSFKTPSDNRIPTSGELFICQPGRHSRPVETNPAPGTVETEPAWAPVGGLIAVARNGGAGFRLYVIRPNGTGLRQLTQTTAHNPSWSPDGKQITFDNGRDIFTIGVDGTSLRRLTHTTARETDPAWSPDSRTIAFVRARSLWLMTSSGTGARKVVSNAVQPAWIAG